MSLTQAGPAGFMRGTALKPPFPGLVAAAVIRWPEADAQQVNNFGRGI